MSNFVARLASAFCLRRIRSNAQNAPTSILANWQLLERLCNCKMSTLSIQLRYSNQPCYDPMSRQKKDEIVRTNKLPFKLSTATFNKCWTFTQCGCACCFLNSESSTHAASSCRLRTTDVDCLKEYSHQKSQNELIKNSGLCIVYLLLIHVHTQAHNIENYVFEYLPAPSC